MPCSSSMIVNTSMWMDTKSQSKDNMGIFSSLTFALTLRCGLLNLWTNLFMRFQTNMAQGFRNQFRSIVQVPSVTAWVNFGCALHMFPNMGASRPTSQNHGCAFRRNMVTHSRPRYTPYFACVLMTPRFGQTPVKETLMHWKERNGWKKTGREGSPTKIGSTSELRI